MTEVTQDKVFEVTTTAQVERTYRVVAADGEAAHKRLRRYLEDPEMVRADLVEPLPDRQIDATPQRVQVEKIAEVPSGKPALAEAVS